MAANRQIEKKVYSHKENPAQKLTQSLVNPSKIRYIIKHRKDIAGLELLLPDTIDYSVDCFYKSECLYICLPVCLFA